MLEWREAMSASTLKELHDLLSTKEYSLSRPSGKPTIGFVFTGQGAQWYAMGRQLLQYPVFLKSMEDSDRSLKKLGSQWSLLGTSMTKKRWFSSSETDTRGALQRRPVIFGESILP